MHESSPAGSPEHRHEEFVALLTASHDRLLGYLLSLLGRWHDAQDVLQRASLLMWQKFGTFEPGTDFLAWASTICFYEAKTFQRTASRATRHFDTHLLELLAAERLDDTRQQEQRVKALELCLENVRGDDRQLLRVSCADHGDIAALAERTGRPRSTLYNKLSHLRRLLAECVMNRMQESAS